jgi:SAM-dependent methyltransferase
MLAQAYMDRLKHLKNLMYSTAERAAHARQQIGAIMVDSGLLLMGQLDRSLPPTRLRFIGNGDFLAIGTEYLGYFREFAALQPHEDVLDIGCGIGRMALPLTKYLERGSYRGIDIVREGIEWCQNNITPKHPNFRFEHANVYNRMYNRAATRGAAEYRFPYADASFDFVFLTSVFTHMLGEDTRHYLSEIGRCLRPGGRVLSTWFLLNEESRRQMLQSPNALKLVHPWDDERFMLLNRRVPEGAVGVDQEFVWSMHAEAGLTIDPNVRWGKWTGRKSPVSYQDIIVARKA